MRWALVAGATILAMVLLIAVSVSATHDTPTHLPWPTFVADTCNFTKNAAGYSAYTIDTTDSTWTHYQGHHVFWCAARPPNATPTSRSLCWYGDYNTGWYGGFRFAANHTCWHKPKPTTTVPTTTTTVPTTTTTPPGECGCDPVTATATATRARYLRATACNDPIVITGATTLTGGCYRSTNPAVPAITINTTAPVELDHVTIEHAGFGVYAYWDYQADLNIHDSTFRQLDPGAGHGSARAVYAYNTLKLVFEYNRLYDGAGVRWAGPDIDATLGRIRYNHATNIGRYSPPEEGLVQFLQTTEIDFPNGLEVAWNKVINTPGLTHVEDVMNFSITDGASGALVDVHHNLLDGSYRPPTTGPYQHTGSGLILGDQGGSYQRAHHNWFVRTLNAGPSIPAGSNLEIDNNVVVVSGLVSGIASGPDWGNGLTLWDNPSYSGVPTNCSIHDNVVGYNRLVSGSLSRSDYWLPQCGLNGNTCSANTSMSEPVTVADEDAAAANWEAARVAAGVVVGPR